MTHAVSIRKTLAIAVLIDLLVVTSCFTIGFQNIQEHDPFIYITFGINGLLWMFFLLLEVKEKAYSLAMIFWFFCLFFFFFAGLIQTMNNQFPWIGMYEDNELLKTNIVLFVWSILFQVGIHIGGKTRFVIIPKKNIDNTRYLNWSVSAHCLIILLILSVLIMAYRINSVGFINLLARGTSAFATSENASIAVLLEKVMMAIVYFAFVLSVYHWRERKVVFPMVMSGICFVLSYFPTSTARSAAAGLYFGAMLVLFPKMRKSAAFVIMYALVFMFVFPLFNAFRTETIGNVDMLMALGLILSNFSSGWLAVDYDAYSMVSLTLRYISLHGVEFGRQLLGVLFFWIPRSIWPSKPESSGPVVADYFGWWFTNVSEPLPAEMIINFGVVGMAFAALVCGFFIRKLDDKYWNFRDDKTLNVTKYDSLYLYMIGYFLFLYRGSLLAAVAYLIAFVFVWLLIPASRTSGQHVNIVR